MTGDPAAQDDRDAVARIDASHSSGLQVGERNTQVNYFYTVLSRAGTAGPASLVGVSGKVEFPYRGLGAFREEDQAAFFGREAAIREIIIRLTRLQEEPGILIVSGVSGSGKSSLLRAGVLPRLRAASAGEAADSASWPCVVMTPTRSPLSELAVRVASLTSATATAIRRDLESDPAGFALLAREAAGDVTAAQDSVGQRRLLLVVDQFEEVFTQCPDEQERQDFIDAMHAAAADRQGPRQAPAALTVLVVRADFEARCASYDQLREPVQRRYLLPPMTEPELRLAISEPARIAGSQAEEGLIDQVLREVDQQSRAHHASAFTLGASLRAEVLPLVSYALDQAWRTRAGRNLTLADYVAARGMEGSVAASADRAYAGLTPSQQAAARDIFLRLTTTSSDGTVSAARASRADLETGLSADDVTAVLNAFADPSVRLVTVRADSAEISHEILINAWDQLREWLAGESTERARYSQLMADARAWDENGRSPSYLYQAGRLAEVAAAAQTWASRLPALTSTCQHFLRASETLAARARKRVRTVIILLSALSVGLTAVTGVTVYYSVTASHERDTAAQQRSIALSRLLAAESLTTDQTDPLTARQLATAAWSASPTAQAASAMTTLLAEQHSEGDVVVGSPDKAATGLAFSPDGKLLATASDGLVRLWNPVTRTPVGAPLHAGTGPTQSVGGLAFSPGGKLLASAGLDGLVRLWNPATGEASGAPLRVGTGQLNASGSAIDGATGTTFSPDGRLLAAGNGDGLVEVWNLTSRKRAVPPLHADQARSVPPAVAFSPRGDILATAGDTVRLWNPVTGKPARIALSGEPHGDTWNTVLFSPDGKVLAAGDENGNVYLWNTATGKLIGPPLRTGTGAEDGVTGLAFTPDSQVVATTAGGSVLLWHASTGKPFGASIRPYASDHVQANGQVLEVAFSPDGQMLATGDDTGAVRLWNPSTGKPIGAPLPADPTDPGRGTAFSQDGKTIAIAEGDDVQLRDALTGEPRGGSFQADAHSSAEGIAISPDGKLLAAGSNHGRIVIWNLSLSPPKAVVVESSASYDATGGMEFSPDGALLAVGGSDGYVRLWNTATGKPYKTPLAVDPKSSEPSVSGIAFSQSGNLIAAFTYSAVAALWNPVTGTLIRRTELPVSVNGSVNAQAISLAGNELAVSTGGTVQFWDLSTRKPVGSIFDGSVGAGINAVTFSQNGGLAAIAESDGYVALWNTATSALVGEPFLADSGGSVYSVLFSPDSKTLAVVTGDAEGLTVQLLQVSVFTSPYQLLCATAGALSRQAWSQFTPAATPYPSICA